MNSPHLLIRADGGIQIGTGHAMRCLALAQAWQSAGGTVTFVLALSTPPLCARLEAEGMTVISLSCEPGSSDDAHQTIAQAHQSYALWTVIDGYHFGTSYQQAIKAAGLQTMVFDDYGHAEHYAADLVLNQNVHAHEGLYTSREPYTRLLLGTRYALLRREFWHWREWKRQTPEVARKILVTMGGSDPENATLKVLHALQQIDIDGKEAVVIVGGSNPYYAELEETARTCSFPIELAHNVRDMPERMAWADVAVSAGGSTCWELAFMGVPAVVLILAENQELVTGKLVETGWFRSPGHVGTLSETIIAQEVLNLCNDYHARLLFHQRKDMLVDGFGVNRVLDVLLKPSHTHHRLWEEHRR